MARMTSADMMRGHGGPINSITGTHMPDPPTGRTGPLPPGSGKHDFYADMDGDQDDDVMASSGGPAKLPGGMTSSTTRVSVDMKK